MKKIIIDELEDDPFISGCLMLIGIVAITIIVSVYFILT